MQENTPNYYGIIPAKVRYSEDVCSGAKLLYCEISALANATGYCWATNAYFANLYKNSTDTISRWVTSLQKAEFIIVEVDNKAGNVRKIWLRDATNVPQKDREPIGKKTDRLPQKDREPIGKNAEYNITENTINNITEKREDTPAFFSKKIDSDKDLPLPTNPPKKERKGRGTLETYLQFVKLSKDEHAQFTEKYGAKFVEDCIEKLDNWIDRQTGAAHEKYLKQNHAACIRGWVVKAVKEDMERAAKRTGSFNGSSNRITSSQAVNLD